MDWSALREQAKGTYKVKSGVAIVVPKNTLYVWGGAQTSFVLMMCTQTTAIHPKILLLGQPRSETVGFQQDVEVLADTPDQMLRVDSHSRVPWV